MGVHIRELLIRAEWKTSRGPGSLLSGTWVGQTLKQKKEMKRIKETIGGDKETQAIIKVGEG